MRAIEKYNRSKTWRGRCRVIYLYHTIKIASHRKWSMRRTAKYFAVGVGTVSEAMLLCSNMSEIQGIKNRRAAVDHLKGL
jgi:RecA-family ATPase